MKKYDKYVGIVIAIILVLSGLVSIIWTTKRLIYNTKEELENLVGYVILAGFIALAIGLNLKLKSKNKIEWGKYPELNSICGWLCFTSWFCLAEAILGGVMSYGVNDEIDWGCKFAISFSIISVLSFWTYLSLILGKRSSLFLLRLYLLSMASLLGLSMIVMKKIPDIDLGTIFYSRDFGLPKDMLIAAIIIITICAIITLCIKGLIISFRTHIEELFKDGRISYWQILVIVLLWVSVIATYHTQFKLTKETHSDYPALNISK